MHVRTFQKLLRAVIAASAIVSAPMGDAFAYWKQPAFSIQASCIVHDLDWDFIPLRPLTPDTVSGLNAIGQTETVSAKLEHDRCVAAAKRYEFQKQVAAAWNLISNETTDLLNSSVALTAQYSRWRDAWVSRIQNPGPTLSELFRPDIVREQYEGQFANTIENPITSDQVAYQASPSDRVATSSVSDNDDLLVGFDWNCHELQPRPVGMMISGKYANVFVYQFDSQSTLQNQEPTNEPSVQQDSPLIAGQAMQSEIDDPADISNYVWRPGVDPICTEVNAPTSFLSWRNLYAPHTCLIAQPRPFVNNEIAQNEVGVCTPVDAPIQYSLADHGAGHCIIPSPNEVAFNEFPIQRAPVVEHPVIADGSSVATFGTFESTASAQPEPYKSGESEPSPLPPVFETIPIVEVSQSVPSLAVEELPPANFSPSEVVALTTLDDDPISDTPQDVATSPSQESIIIDSPPTSYEYDTWYDSPQFEDPTIDAIPVFETAPSRAEDLVTDPVPTTELTPTLNDSGDEAPPAEPTNTGSTTTPPTSDGTSTSTDEAARYQPEPYRPIESFDAPIISSPSDLPSTVDEPAEPPRGYGDWLADVSSSSNELWCFPNSAALKVRGLIPAWNWSQLGGGIASSNHLVVGAHRRMIEELSLNAIRISRNADKTFDTGEAIAIVPTDSVDAAVAEVHSLAHTHVPMLEPMFRSAKVALWSGMKSYEPATYNLKHQAAEQLAKQLNVLGTTLIHWSNRIQQVTEATELARRATESFRSTQ